ncbi:MAG: hypothetical protein H7Y09_05565 [Chitinophagaceae bacterium]|nr:hypothetical protein [Anaerolineae bacterium]
MTLSIGVLYIDKSSGLEKRFSLPPGKHLFGFESYRERIWGADIMTHLGLIILPNLLHIGCFSITGDRLNQLEREGHIILDNIDLITEQTRYDSKENIKFHVDNLLDAIKLAKQSDGKMIIG